MVGGDGGDDVGACRERRGQAMESGSGVSAEAGRGADPENGRAMWRRHFEERADGVAGEAVGGGEGSDGCAGDVDEAKPSACPGGAVGGNEDAADEVVGKAVRDGPVANGGWGNFVEAVGGACPEITVWPCGEREDDGAGELIGLDGKCGARAAKDAIVPRAEVHVSVGIANDGGDSLGVGTGCSCKFAWEQRVDTGGFGSNPEVAFAVCEDGENGFAAERL